MLGKNNPFNIRNNKHNKWCGQVGSHKGFCCFSERIFGIRAAAIILIRSYRYFGLCTIKDIISRWAPSNENDTKSYIYYCCTRLGFPCNTALTSLQDYEMLMVAMAYMEGNPVTLEEIHHVCILYDIYPVSLL